MPPRNPKQPPTMKDTFKLIDEITKSQPSEFVACFSHAEYFKEYGFKSSVRHYRWVWIFDRLIKEDSHELERLLALSKA